MTAKGRNSSTQNKFFLTIKEGKFHQVKMLEAVGNKSYISEKNIFWKKF